MASMPVIAIFYAFTAGGLWVLGFIFFLGFGGVNVRANRWLGVFYGIMACTFAQLFLEAFGIGEMWPIHLLELPRWAMLPCFYMAVYHYVTPSRPSKIFLLHFVPFLLFLLFSLIYLMPYVSHKTVLLPELPRWLGLVVQYFFFGQMVYYWVACLWLFRRHQRNIKQVASYTERIDLEWLKYILISVLLLILIRILSMSSMYIIYYTPILYFLGIILLAYATLTQKSIYAMETHPSVEREVLVPKKEGTGRLTPVQVEELQSMVIRKTIGEKLYMDPSLTLSVLAESIGMRTHELSYVLNNGVGKSFYQFINELRTEEAKSLLLSEDTKHLDMFGVAIRAGFNSKTTFYTTFKKATGLTPKEYIKTYSGTIGQ